MFVRAFTPKRINLNQFRKMSTNARPGHTGADYRKRHNFSLFWAPLVIPVVGSLIFGVFTGFGDTRIANVKLATKEE